MNVPRKEINLKGVFPALVTPFDRKTEAVDEDAFRELIRYALPHIDGVVSSGISRIWPLFAPLHRSSIKFFW